MTEPRLEHWTDDDEILESYVLHRLAPEQQRDLDQHLRVCAQCRERVRAEVLLLGVIRSAGRTEFKTRLREEIRRATIQRFPARRVLSIAAALAITLTAGITAFLFLRQQGGQPMADQQIMNRSLPGPPKDAGSEVTGSAGALRKGVPEAPAAVRSREKSDNQIAEATGIQQESNNEQKAAGPPRVSRSKGPTKQEAPSVVHSPEASGTSRILSSLSSAPSRDSVWLAGTVIRNQQPSQEPDAVTSRKQMAHDSREVLVRLKQETFSAVQRRPDNVQKAPTNAQRITALLRRLPAGVELTLFPDTLWNEKDLLKAQVESAGIDSIIVRLSDVHIAYKLPPGWMLPRTDSATPPHQ